LSKNIVTTNKTVPTSHGLTTYYTTRVVETKSDGSTTEVAAESTSDYKEAEENYQQSLHENPGATVNGEARATADPFNDGTMPSPVGAKYDYYDLDTKLESDLLSTPTTKFSDAGVVKMDDFSFSSGETFLTPGGTSTITKKAYDLSGVSDAFRSDIEALDRKQRAELFVHGAFGTSNPQAEINRLATPSQKETRSGNAFIICGPDTTGHHASGYGGKAHTQCDSILLTAGMGGSKPKQSSEDGELVYTNPNFFVDAAMIYISQKTDTDTNFAIGKEENYDKSEGKSGIIVKADHVRLVGRESLRLITNTDTKNSQGGDIHSWNGIWLMANNDEDELQPMVKGDNLVDALEKMSDHLKQLTKFFHSYVRHQQKYNRALATHQHFAPFFAIETTPSKELPPESIKNAIKVMTGTELSVLKSLHNYTGFKKNFLMEHGPSFINSTSNKTN